MFEENPYLIEDPESIAETGSTALVLIHDGGGTTFSYHCLSSIGRRVYGIYNPKFWTGDRFEGGIPEMAQHYVDLLLEEFAYQGETKVFLGGWSLGGMIAIEMSQILVGHPSLSVAGLLLIDSPYPYRSIEPYCQIDSHVFEGKVPSNGEVGKLLMQQFKHAEAAVVEWQPSILIGASSALSTPVSGDGEGCQGCSNPFTILMRASEFVPVRHEARIAQPWAVCNLDAYRTYEDLGWSKCPGLINMVSDVPGHHFSLFDEGNITDLSERIAQACVILDMQDMDHSISMHQQGAEAGVGFSNKSAHVATWISRSET